MQRVYDKVDARRRTGNIEPARSSDASRARHSAGMHSRRGRDAGKRDTASIRNINPNVVANRANTQHTNAQRRPVDSRRGAGLQPHGRTARNYDAKNRNGKYTRHGSAGLPKTDIRYKQNSCSGQAVHNRNSRNVPPRRNTSKGNTKFIIIGLMVIVCLIYLLHTMFVLGVGEEKFYNGVSLNDVDLSNMSWEEGAAAIVAHAEETINTTYELTYGDNSWTFSASMVNATMDVNSKLQYAWNLGRIGNIFERKSIIKSLSANPVSLECEITYDEELLDSFIDGIASSIDRTAKDATVVVGENGPYIAEEASNGYELDKAATRELLLSLMLTGNGNTELSVTVTEPQLSTEDAQQFTQLIVEYSTDVSFRASDSRGNVRLALLNFNGFVLYPGEECSFNEIVGKRTTAKGYKMATAYSDGTTTQEVGGGVCQASTTLYGALLKAGVTIVERYPHSMTVSYIKPSLDAAVTSSSKDLKFRNDTDHPMYIYTEVTNDDATVRIYGYMPEYRYELVSVVTDDDIPSTTNSYIEDEEGKYVVYTNETYLYSKGKSGCKSQGWMIAYDWDTGEEVERIQLSSDYYSPGNNVYYVGVTTPVVTRTTEY